MPTELDRMIEELEAVEQSGDDRILWNNRARILAALKRLRLAEKYVADSRRLVERGRQALALLGRDDIQMVGTNRHEMESMAAALSALDAATEPTR